MQGVILCGTIIRAMRRVYLILLLIALLPLRGWVIDAMAMQTLNTATVSASATEPIAHCDMHPDDDAQAATSAQDTAAHPASPHSSTCTTCQFCHAATLLTYEPLLAALPLPQATPVARLPVPTEAVSALALKPPIS